MRKNILMRKATIILLLFLFTGKAAVYGQQEGRITFKGTVEGMVDVSTSSLAPMGEVSVFVLKPKRELLGKTDGEGRFSVTVPVGTVLTFEYVGFETINVTATEANNNKLHVMTIKSESGTMENVAVVGFKKVFREVNTGSSVVISGKELQDMPAADITSLLQGRIAGLNIQNNDGAPGARSSVFMRGLSNISVQGEGAGAYLTPTSPLFVVDGVPVDMNTNFEYGFNQGGPGVSPISMIPPEDLEEIAFLKDAAATALWGSRGAYGVILITTKRGKSQRPMVQYSGSVFYNGVPRLRDVIGGKDERYLRINQILDFDTSYQHALSLINGTSYLSDSLNAYWNNSTNWQGVFFKPTVNHSHNVNVYGGTDKFNYKTNVGYFQQKGIIRNTGFRRYNLNMNATFQPNERFRLRVSTNSGLSQNQKGSGVGLLQDGVARGSRASSLLPPPSMFSENNAALAGTMVEDDNKTFQITPAVNIMWMPVRDLQLQSETNYFYSSGTSDNFRPSIVGGGSASYFSYSDRTDRLYNRNQLNYNRSLGRDANDQSLHNLNIFLFNELQMSSYKAQLSSINTLPNDYILGPVGYNWYGSRGGTLDNLSEGRNLAFGGSFEYNFKLKYVLSFQYRMDGSSTNGPNTGYKRSPTVSARWNMHSERWFEKALPWINMSSARVSYGTVLMPTGTIFDVYGKYTPNRNFNGVPTVGSDFGTIPNVNFEPMSNTQFNFGYEGTYFRNRLNLSYDFYYNVKDKQLWRMPLANTSGFGSIIGNDLALVSYGNEFMLGYRSIPTTGKNAFNWNVSANLAINNNVLAKFPNDLRQYIKGDESMGLPVLYRLGAVPLKTLVYNTKGVYATDADVATDPATGLPIQVGRGSGIFLRAGDPYWADLNGDYVIDDNDLAALFNPQPKMVGGVQFYAKYGQFSVNTNVSFTMFRDVINTALAERFRNFSQPSSQQYSDFLSNGVLVPIDQYNYWRADGDAATYPNPYNFIYYPRINPFRYNQTLFIEDGSYWKLNQVTLRYEVPQTWLRRLRLTSTAFTLTGGNLLVISPYSGSSPENVTDLGRDNPNGYPNARTVSLGLNIQF